MNTNETQSNDNQTERADQLTDLEPQDEVKGGVGVDPGRLTLNGVISEPATYGRGTFEIFLNNSVGR